ncbi:MAG TPA: DUF4153 domain-containing protein [Thermoguttaceae bacterium]|nr:DUF4153 domain-containing protein [Thermoguttaceae bacterium]
MDETKNELRDEDRGAGDGGASPFKDKTSGAAGEPIVASVVHEPDRPAAGTQKPNYGWLPPPLPGECEKSQAPLSWREPVAAVAMIALCDLAIFRGHGWAGFALVFAVAPVLLAFGVFCPRAGRAFWLTGAMLVVLAAKMVWCVPWLGWLMLGTGFSLVAAVAMSLSGRPPYVLAVVLFASQTLRAGCERLNDYGRRLVGIHAPSARLGWLSVALPLAALLTFGMIFIVANPAVWEHFSEQVEIFFGDLREWLANFSAWEVVFWIAVLWIGVGLLRLASAGSTDDSQENSEREKSDQTHYVGQPGPAPLWAAWRNTLIAVILLFAVYLVFEFKTLWFHEFPKGFYYSGYAHEGAAWLTVALGLATAMLSLIFGGRTLADPRVRQLRRLAWIWSAQNLMLAAAVYNRLGIYIGFNGMTRMRIIGLFGISAVVVGFVLVLRKIAANRSFTWLVRRHLWTLAAAVYLLVITPVDAIVVRYNVGRILAGDLKPSVQITVHPISSEGIVLLRPLLECKNETIREGVRALLAQRDEQTEKLVEEQERLGWTAYQRADRMASDWFRKHRAEWNTFDNPAQRQAAYDAFTEYAYQWF